MKTTTTNNSRLFHSHCPHWWSLMRLVNEENNEVEGEYVNTNMNRSKSAEFAEFKKNWNENTEESEIIYSLQIIVLKDKSLWVHISFSRWKSSTLRTWTVTIRCSRAHANQITCNTMATAVIINSVGGRRHLQLGELWLRHHKAQIRVSSI